MANRRKSLPQVPPSVDPALRQLLSAFAEIVETGEGVRGNPLDKKLTLRDLLDSGIGTVRRGARPGSPGSLAPGDGAPPNMSVPPAPSSLAVTGGLGYIFLDWGIPQDAYGNHGYTEIWRHTEDNLANAVLHGQTGSSMFADMNTQVGETYYYWIRFVSSTNVKGPYNSPNGMRGKESEDPGILLARLSGEIKESHLYEHLQERINLIDGPPDLAGSVAQRVQNEASERALAIQAESEARDTAISAAYSELTEYADTDSVAAQSVSQLVAALGGNAAEALSYMVSEVDEQLAVSTSFDQISARFSSVEDGLDSKASITAVNQALAEEEGARTTQINHLQALYDNIEQPDLSSYAQVSYVEDAVVAESVARALAITQVSSKVGENSAAIQIHQEAIDGLSAQWSVKTDVNDLVGGIGLLNDGEKVSFLASVHSFGIIAPGAETLSFFVEDERVVMDAANIVNLVVQDAQIGSVSVEKIVGLTGTFIEARIQNLHVDKITGDVSEVYTGSNSSERGMSRNYIYSRAGLTIPNQTRARRAFMFAEARLRLTSPGSRSVRILLYEDRGDGGGGSSMSARSSPVFEGENTYLRWYTDTNGRPTSWDSVAVGDEIRIMFDNGTILYGRVERKSYDPGGEGGGVGRPPIHTIQFSRIICPGSSSFGNVSSVLLKKSGTQARFNWTSPVMSGTAIVSGEGGEDAYLNLHLGSLPKSTLARSYVVGVQVVAGVVGGITNQSIQVHALSLR